MNSRSDPCPECGLYEAPPTRRTDLACSFCGHVRRDPHAQASRHPSGDGSS